MSRSSRARGSRSVAPPVGAEDGYTLAFLMVVITIMNIAVATALPYWTTFVQREKEAELIHRGLQYAEAIRVFQKANNRLPITLEELYEKKPRSIRKLYEDPMSESGRWGLLVQGGAPQGQAPNQQPNQQQGPQGDEKGEEEVELPRGVGFGGRPPAGNAGRPGAGAGTVVAIPPAKDEDRGFGEPIQRTTGPIVGVYSAAEGKAMRRFMDADGYSQWHFKADLIPVPAILGGDKPAPRVTSAWIGKPFRDDIKIQQNQPGGQGVELGGGGPQQGQRGLDAASFRPGGSNRGNRRDRNR